METQLVRHDKPYNIILGSNGRFALHVATLIVVKERIEGLPEGVAMSDTLSVCSYPVVKGLYGIDGQVWMKSELNDCIVICREYESVTLFTLKRVMEYCGKHNVLHYKDRIPSSFVMALLSFDAKLDLSFNENEDSKVDLIFETGEHGIRCMVYSSKESDFYFYEYYADDYADYSSVGLINRPEAIRSMARLRNEYLRIFKYDGLSNIKFTTKQSVFQDFVDELNNYKIDEGV